MPFHLDDTISTSTSISSQPAMWHWSTLCKMCSARQQNLPNLPRFARFSACSSPLMPVYLTTQEHKYLRSSVVIVERALLLGWVLSGVHWAPLVRWNGWCVRFYHHFIPNLCAGASGRCRCYTGFWEDMTALKKIRIKISNHSWLNFSKSSLSFRSLLKNVASLGNFWNILRTGFFFSTK